MRFVNPGSAETPLEKATFEKVGKIQEALGGFETMDDVNSSVNALITMLSANASMLCRNEIEALEYADNVKSAIISYYVHVTKE